MSDSQSASAKSEGLIWVSIAAMGEWSALPELESKFELSLETVTSSWREDLIQRGWDTEIFEKSLLKKLRNVDHVVFGELSFRPYIDAFPEGPFPSRQLRWAKLTAKTLKGLSDHGALALYYDGSGKAYTPDMFEQLDLNDHATLFHLFVEIWGDDSRVCTEGMSLFGLPEICVEGLEPESAEAQATVFSLAAQLVCDGLRLYTGQRFRASESFPWCEARWVEGQEEARLLMNQGAQQEEDPDEGDRGGDFPCGVLFLTPSKGENSLSTDSSCLS